MLEIQSPDALKNLVKVIIGLAILGLIIALIIYTTGIITGQQALAAQAPLNICGPEWGCGPE